VSSRNLKAGTSRSEAGVASDTRRCLVPEEEGEGNGAVNEKVEVCVPMVVAIWLDGMDGWMGVRV
jgi:hypothetical protein